MRIVNHLPRNGQASDTSKGKDMLLRKGGTECEQPLTQTPCSNPFITLIT